MQWTDDLLVQTCGDIFRIEKWVAGLVTSSCKQTSNSQSSAILYFVVLTGRPLLFRLSSDSVPLTFLTRSYKAILEQLKVRCSFQILLTFYSFSRESFFMTAVCSFLRTFFLNYLRNPKNCQYQNWGYRIFQRLLLTRQIVCAMVSFIFSRISELKMPKILLFGILKFDLNVSQQLTSKMNTF